MSFSKISALAGVLSLASTVAAHGHVTGLTVDGTFIGGWELAYGYTATPPAVPGWTTKALDNGFVAPSLFGTSDIACHLGATAGQAYATVAAGSSVDVKWDTWPESHHGPVIDALASCGDDCTTATAGSLEFFVIAKKGLVDGSSAPGVWASDELMANGNTWSVTIPASIAPGKYVLRHEIMALHGAGAADGAQNYPQCLNLEVTGSGTLKPAGVTADKFYTPTDPGILVSIYAPLGDSYVIPGPAVFSGGDAAPAPAPTSDDAPVASASATVAPVATSPSEEYPTVTAAPTVISPPYTNGTIPSSTKSACKSKTTAAAPLPTSTTPDEEYPSEDPATPVVTVVPTPLATGTPSSPTSPSTPVDSTPSEELPTGTKLSSVLAWISSFYTANKDTVYTGASTLKKRSHARAMRL